MEEAIDLAIQEALAPLSVPSITDKCKFWMIRTKQGVFYHEFIENNFIAIGWNLLTSDSISCSKDEALKKLIKENYGDRIPGTALNKCRNFIQAVSPGDIAMIVSQDKIAFATIGEYFEAIGDNYSFEKEMEANEQIEGHFNEWLKIPCPYKKRRKITLIKQINAEDINPYLYKPIISNHHSLSSINEYGDLILSSCNSIFIKNSSITVSFRINKKDGIDPKLLAKFMNNTADVLSNWGDYQVETKISAHSPGDISFIIQGICSSWNQLSNEFKFLLVYTICLGGSFKFGNFEVSIPSLANLAKWICKHKHQKKMEEFEEQKAALEIKERQEKISSTNIKNQRDQLKLEKELMEAKKDEQGIKKTQSTLEEIKNSSKALNITPINVSDDFLSSEKKKDDKISS